MCVFVHVLVPDLRGTDDGLAGRVAASNHHLLGDENFLCRDLNPQVASGNHHAIALSQDLLKTDREIRGGDEEDSEFGIKKGGVRRAQKTEHAGMRKQEGAEMTP